MRYLLVLGLVGCAPHGDIDATLAELPGLAVQVRLQGGVNVAVLYDVDAFRSVHDGCAVIDASGSLGGIALEVLSTGEERPETGECDMPWFDAAPPANATLLEISDRSLTVTAEYAPGQLVPSVATPADADEDWIFAPGSEARFAWSRPQDLALGVSAYYFGFNIGSQEFDARADGSDIVITFPTAPFAPLAILGIETARPWPVEPALSCSGAQTCTSLVQRAFFHDAAVR